jgi:enoyl-CoA hydratase/carnithine racemase
MNATAPAGTADIVNARAGAPTVPAAKAREILCEISNHIAFITLNRPEALNALSLDMIIELRSLLDGYAADPQIHAVLIKGAGGKAFCAGGDIRALYQSFKNSGSLHREFFLREYPLDYLLYAYPKPYAVLMDGITMGGGMGLAQGSTLRIVGERTRIAMPEVAIGFFPDVGASYFLSRLPGAIGVYLALT